MFDNLVAFAMLLVLGKWNMFEKEKSGDFYYPEEKEKYKMHIDRVKLGVTERNLF